MKIGPLDPKAPVAPVASERPAAPARAARPAGEEASAQVELSSTALAADTSADFDAEKVERIAQAIRDGKFQVNAEAIADKLIANAQELLSRSSH
jgi:negative regulator of flagellin synthesis FlgM